MAKIFDFCRMRWTALITAILLPTPHQSPCGRAMLAPTLRMRKARDANLHHALNLLKKFAKRVDNYILAGYNSKAVKKMLI